MHWNYRVIEFVDPRSGPWRAIHEVFYDDEGRPNGYAESPAEVLAAESDGDEWELGLGQVLDMMRSALDKPVLVERDFQREPSKET